VSSRIEDRNVWVVYAAILLLGLAYGDSLAVTALHLDAVGFSKRQIGTLAAWFAGGIVAMSLPAGGLVRTLSARRAVLLCLVGYAVAVALFPFQRSYAGAAAVRFVDGACSVGVWVGCETILLSRSSPSNKAFVMSLYAMSLALGYVGGSLLARGVVAVTTMRAAFLSASALAVLAALVVGVWLDADAVMAERAVEEGAGTGARPSGWTLAWRIKTSCFATFSYGYFQASVVLFLPLYLVAEKHVTKEETVVMPAVFAGGMLLFTNVAARLGDRLGHLRVMRAQGATGTLMILGFVLLDAWTPMLGAIFVAGASLASISPVSLALQGKIADPADYARANAIYNAFYAAGMLLGPPLSSALFERLGGPAMLYHLAAMWAAFVALTVAFAGDDPRSRATFRA
jgi:predicted MFS family arabinose efflux permease